MKSPEFYIAPSVDLEHATQGGIHYATGVSFLHDPEGFRRYHNIDIERQPEKLVVVAAQLIHSGLMKVIQHSNPPEIRRSVLKMEKMFESAELNLYKTKTNVYNSERATEHLPAIALLEPFPILDESIYKRFCHGHFGGSKLPLSQMMDNVPIHDTLSDLIRPDTYRSVKGSRR
jgi:hypothetical protein